MEIAITNWALQSYLELNHTFSDKEYREILRPDVELLKEYPQHAKFNNDKFWGPCKDKSGKIIRHGYKMKWHNIGSGGIQLRLSVALINGTAWLCNAYMKLKIQLINEGRYILRGRL
jgi:hypothetical protein